MKRHLISFGVTFVASFLTLLGSAVAVLSPEAIMMPETWTTTFIAGLILGAVRGAVKVASEKFLLK